MPSRFPPPFPNPPARLSVNLRFHFLGWPACMGSPGAWYGITAPCSGNLARGWAFLGASISGMHKIGESTCKDGVPAPTDLCNVFVQPSAVCRRESGILSTPEAGFCRLLGDRRIDEKQLAAPIFPLTAADGAMNLQRVISRLGDGQHDQSSGQSMRLTLPARPPPSQARSHFGPQMQERRAGPSNGGSPVPCRWVFWKVSGPNPAA
jgi:hypothetical protein